MQYYPKFSPYRIGRVECLSSIGRVCALVVGSLVLTTAAQAQISNVSTVNTVNDPIGDSGFELTFPDLNNGMGLTTSSSVVNTQIEFEIDEQAGTARFVKYSQLVEPLLLPGPNGEMISTGDITINIVSSEGTYNSSAETFETNDVFEIGFTGDLSGFGLVSPKKLPAVSKGTVTGGTQNSQRIDMVWEGSGQLGDPAQPLRFNYKSKNFTVVQRPIAPFLSPLQACGNGLFGFFGLGLISLMFVGMKLSIRRRRTR